MTELMLEDTSSAQGLRYAILRYFNVAGADPMGRAGQSTKGATHLIKVAVGTALGMRPKMSVFGTDYPTPDGTRIRDYIHVWDLVRAHADALAYLRAGGSSVTLNCGYGRGFSVLEFIETVSASPGSILRWSSPRGDRAIRLSDVAAAERACSILNGRPEFDNLPTIVSRARLGAQPAGTDRRTQELLRTALQLRRRAKSAAKLENNQSRGLHYYLREKTLKSLIGPGVTNRCDDLNKASEKLTVLDNLPD
jgi:UDP-glucose 4-epimerase